MKSKSSIYSRLSHLAVATLTLSAIALSHGKALATSESASQAGISASEPGSNPGQQAPEFTLPDAQGKKQSLAAFKGKWVVLEWVNYDCPFVKKHYGSGNMQSLQKEMRDKGLVWLPINSSADGKQGSFREEILRERMKKEKATPDHYLIDATGRVGNLYDAKTTPTLILISPSGKIAYTGAIDDHPSTDADDIPKSINYLRQAVSQALGGKPIAMARTKSYGCSVKYAD